MLTNCYLILFKYKINFILCQRLFTIACLFRFDLISTLRFNTPAFFLKKKFKRFYLNIYLSFDCCICNEAKQKN